MANLNLMGEMLKTAKAFDAVPHSLQRRSGGRHRRSFGTGRLRFDAIAAQIEQVHAQKVRALVVTSQRRHPQLQEVQTLDEVGVRGMSMVTFNGLLAPAGPSRAGGHEAHSGHEAGDGSPGLP